MSTHIPSIPVAAILRISSIYLNEDVSLIVTGETGRYDYTGNEYKKNVVFDMLKISGTEKVSANREYGFKYYPVCPGKQYSDYTKNEFDQFAWKSSSYQHAKFFSFLNNFKTELLTHSKIDKRVVIEASPFVSTQVATVEGKPHVYLANFSGLKSDEVVDQISEKNIKIQFTVSSNAKIFYLPFLGEKQQLKTSFKNGKVVCVVPMLTKGGVVWAEE